MALNQVQVKHVNRVIRPYLETLILARDRLATFISEHEAFQAGPNALPTDATVLDDNDDGTAPREDAPTLTGDVVQIILNRSPTMRDVITGAELQTLIDLMVRDLETIRSG